MSRVIINDSYYFLTTPTFNHEDYLSTDKKKSVVLKQFNKIKKKFNISIHAYSIAKNHYHLLFYLKDKNNLKDVVRIINGGSSFIINRLDGIDRKIWGSYWTKIILEESMFYNIMGYIIGNLLKHGEVNNFEELNKSVFSSFSQIYSKYGFNFARDLVKNVIRLDLEEDYKFNKNLFVKELTKAGQVKHF